MRNHFEAWIAMWAGIGAAYRLGATSELLKRMQRDQILYGQSIVKWGPGFRLERVEPTGIVLIDGVNP